MLLLHTSMRSASCSTSIKAKSQVAQECNGGVTLLQLISLLGFKSDQ